MDGVPGRHRRKRGAVSGGARRGRARSPWRWRWAEADAISGMADALGFYWE